MGFKFYQAHRAKRKKGGILKAGETRISTSNFYTEDCAALPRKIIMGTIELVENRDRYQFIEYSQLNKYLCACLELLKKQIDVGHSVIYMDQIKSESVCMIMKMVQSNKAKEAKSTYKENITSSITPYRLIMEIDGIE